VAPSRTGITTLTIGFDLSTALRINPCWRGTPRLAEGDQIESARGTSILSPDRRDMMRSGMADPPTALALTHEPPLPSISGTRVRSLNLIRQLANRGWKVSLFTLGIGDDPGPRDRRLLEAICERVTVAPFEASRAERYARIGLGVARRRAFQESYFHSRAAAAELERVLADRRFDVILADQLYMYPYVPDRLRATTVLDCHNVELRRIETTAATLGRNPRGVVARLQLGAVARLERDAVRSVAGVLAVSEPEREHFEQLAPGKVSLVPNGVDCAAHEFRGGTSVEPRILFIGSMDYSANADAASYLIREILPRVRRRDALLTVVGGSPPRLVARQAASAPLPTEVVGRVPSTQPYLEGSRLLAAPLRFGGGTRIKILEALARGLPVVTTSLGCEGLGLTHERELLIADDPQRFAEAIDRLLDDDELCESLARRGRQVVEERYDWRRIGERLDAALSRVAGRSWRAGDAREAGAR
jgi:polysaccharide biosynthesis protein PslH